RLGTEADRFEANAYRFIGLETLRQTQPAGTRFSTGPRGIVTGLPAITHVVVSEFGFVSSDEPGGSLKEVRSILTVDGVKWARGKKELSQLANGIASRDARNPAKTLERFEDYGLRGFLSDAGQLILLFARRWAEKYEFTVDRDGIDTSGPVWVFRYQQIDGNAALNIYGEKEPMRERLAGEVWLSAGDGLPVRITIEAKYVADATQVRDVTAVSYQMSQWGFLLPSAIDHRQFVDGSLFVIDEFRYEGFKEVLSARPRK
ncbi:MAG TPA: hypothetical protein VER03_19335, partial [Bryobacteraceae bacterium]|nr:hypothetical protein [Bryobacteraceae bacterium]